MRNSTIDRNTSCLNNSGTEKRGFIERYDKATRSVLMGDVPFAQSMQEYVDQYLEKGDDGTDEIFYHMGLYHLYLTMMKEEFVSSVVSELGEDASYKEIYDYLDRNWDNLFSRNYGSPDSKDNNCKTGAVYEDGDWKIDNIHDGIVTLRFGSETVRIDCVKVPYDAYSILIEDQFNPKKSTLVKALTNDLDKDDPRYICEQLYRTQDGFYFIFGEGGPLTKYKDILGFGYVCGGFGILPLTKEEATKWLTEKGLDPSLKQL